MGRPWAARSASPGSGLLDAQRGALLPPVRAEIFGAERFAQHGRSLGSTHRASAGGRGESTFFPRLRENIDVLRQAHAHLALKAVDGEDVSPAAEWLLDNFHLIEAQLVEAHEGLPRRYFRSLPLLLDAPLAGLPRIYGVAWAFVAHTDSAFDEALLLQFLRAYQETRDLKLAEIWALPTTLRVVLVENLRRLAEREAVGKAARELADRCADGLEARSLLQFDALHARLARRGAAGTFLAQLWHRVQGLPDRPGEAHAALCRQWLARVLPDPAALLRQQAADQTADNLSMSNAVGSLRAIGDAEWTDLVEHASALVRLMLQAPGFAAEQAETRSRALHRIERLARRSGRSEQQVAQALLGLMRPASGTDRVDGMAIHWLEGEGRAALLLALGLPEPMRARLRALARVAALPLYLGCLLLGTALLTLGLLHRYGLDEPWAWTALTVALMLLPASEAVVALINRLISESVQPKGMPRLALAEGIPPAHRVLVVVPALLTDPATVAALMRRLLLHHLANPEAQAQFALLSDWVDADRDSLPGDAALLAQAESLARELNAQHPEAGAPRFIVLHRRRSFSESEQCWIGWDRKRGKLEQLIAALATGHSDAFIDLGRSSQRAEAVRYVVTLDSDTELPPGRLRDLVGVAAHPYNRPQLAADGRSVVAGHGVLQPRIVTPLPGAGRGTHFHALFAGHCGIDPYSAATSEVYQDLFGEGSFSGKGLLHVQAAHAVLGQRLPTDRVLSHDLLEGALLRCGVVSDVTLIEEAPFHADVAASRVRRWTRGDWQLLPFLLHPGRWSLRVINRWKLTDNLRRSLVAPAALALLVLSLLGHGLPPVAAVLLVLAAFGTGPVIGAVAGFAPSRDNVALGHFYRVAGGDLLRALATALWHLAQGLLTARTALQAIGQALWRQGWSQRHLMQWNTAAAAQARAGTTLRVLLRQHRVEPVLAAVLLAALLAADAAHPVWAVGLCLLWAASPLAIWWASRPHAAAAGEALDVAERAAFEGVARDAWRYFERVVTAADLHLPPDNLQTSPVEAVAHRTSPTNIGLYLLSAACAQAFGWITPADLVRRLQATLGTLQRLQRHRGHFLNWYDTQTGLPLMPPYVSTVDSGNLSGHLLTVGQACLELANGLAARADAAQVPALQALAARCDALAWEADYAFLYHRKRHLLHIGYRVQEQQLDGGFYDLLASESRLTSLLAIAKGDVPVRHWAALGRPFFALGSAAGLRSWAGSMFEYLMPGLVLAEPVGSALHGAGSVALREQMRYAQGQGVPWGISESAYAGRDSTLAYQYAPQGVPRLALRRTPAHELVVAPYATALAAPLAPRQALANFGALEDLGARGACGFIEALDFTPARLAAGERCALVETTMAHHQGMSVVALANLLLDGVAQRWGMANAHLEAVSSLLHERAPREVSVLRAPPAAVPGDPVRGATTLQRTVSPGAAAVEPTQLLGNGRYSVALRANGAGLSRRLGLGLTRWRDDALRDAHGSFCFLRWDRQPLPVSITQRPAPDSAAQYQCVFHADRVAFNASWPGLEASLTVWVSPEDDIEFRQVELHNRSERWLDIELLSAFEPTLSDDRADEAHPAFGKLFLRADWLAGLEALVFERTPRLAGEPALHLAHFVAESDPQLLGVQVQADRQRWLGRNRDASRPLAAFDPTPVEGDTRLDTGLDPVCALALRLRIAPLGQARLTLATAAGDDAATLRAVIDKYRQPSHVQRAALMSATLAGIRGRELQLSADSMAALQCLSTALLLTLSQPSPTTPAGATTPAIDRRGLWRFGISGERPLLLVSVGVLHGLALVRTLAQALRWWAWAGVACDLVVLDGEPVSYPMALQHELHALREAHTAALASAPGTACTALHVLRQDELSADERGTLAQLARLHLQCDGRSLAQQVQAWLDRHEVAHQQRQAVSGVALPVAVPDRVATAASGRFDAASGDFVFDVDAMLRPARPWINVLANPDFGCQLSEAGAGYTWAGNSRLQQLTAWSNDPVADPVAEWLLLQDVDSRQTWSLAPSATGEAGARHRVRHGQGYTEISHRRGLLDVRVTWCVDAEAAVKQVQVRLVNHGNGDLNLRLVAVAEWAMGAGRADRHAVHTALFRQRLGPGSATSAGGDDAKLTALLATQCEQAAGFGGSTAWLAVADAADVDIDWTCDRRELFDARGRALLPDHLGQRAGAGLDPCAALSLPLRLAPGGTANHAVLLGHAATPAAAREAATRAAAVPPWQRLAQARAQWDRLLGATVVRTPDPVFDALVNRWLLYQTVSCRLWAKAGLYQAGGAIGFRDQLQDAMSLAWAAPHLLREQIVLAASRQFTEGDVQHWWHAPGGAGVRTHSSDDLLWLPLACTHHLQRTGDASLLDTPVPFLQGGDIPPGAEDLYETPTVSAETATVYEHAARAIDHSLRVGVHGLPLMGGGDWNDGMNRVGHLGRGESVWLGWFLWALVQDWAPLARSRGDDERARRWEQAATGWQEALQGPAWDGHWFKRAFFDDGQALGSHGNDEARIDLIAQAWSVLSDAVPRPLQVQAMQAVDARLVDAEAGLIRLLDPPLAQAVPSAGYIQAYPPGVRENGGQYSHGAIWALMARARQATRDSAVGDDDAVWRDFTWLSPAHRSQHPTQGPAYGLEPYAVAGDICTQPPWVGRGGWSWYTGAAGWLHRAAIESLFGLQMDAQDLQVRPCLPSHWPLAELTLRRDGLTLGLAFMRAPLAQVQSQATQRGARLLLPGERMRWAGLQGEHHLLVPLPPAAADPPAPDADADQPSRA